MYVFPAESGADFFSIAGFEDPFLASLIMSCIGLATTIVYAFIIDKVGRRPLAIPFYAFCSATLWLIGALYYSHSKATQTVLVSQASALVATCTLTQGSSSSHVFGRSRMASPPVHTV